MAEINADLDDVLDGLTSRIGVLEKENAVLVARLKNAAKQIDDLSGEKSEDVHDVTTLPKAP